MECPEGPSVGDCEVGYSATLGWQIEKVVEPPFSDLRDGQFSITFSLLFM